MHTKRSESDFWYKCLKPNCLSSFPYQGLLDLHMRSHNNDMDKCQYCPYRYVRSTSYADHLNKHFQIKDHKCENCGATFTTKNALIQHSSIHEGILYCCLICNTYEASSRMSMKMHLRKKHTDLLGQNINWDSVKKYVNSHPSALPHLYHSAWQLIAKDPYIMSFTLETLNLT